MTIKTIKGNLFDAPRGFYLAHCISADFALGAGIAVQFNDRYNMRYRLREMYEHGEVGKAIMIDEVFNLVTKERAYDKPTYDSLRDALWNMRECMQSYAIDKIAMPRIGCGLDRLDWDRVYDIIADTFADLDVEILIYELV